MNPDKEGLHLLIGSVNYKLPSPVTNIQERYRKITQQGTKYTSPNHH